MITSLLLEVALALSGIIIPRFFTALYGSAVNGLVSSINQFITYMSLAEAGIGAAGMVALYKPLAENNYQEINGIVSAARSFYLRSGWIFVGLAAVLIGVYPLVVQSEIADAGFVRMMILLLLTNGIVDYFFLGKYRVLLQADQRNYVISLAQIAGVIVVTIVSLLLIHLKASALLVKGTAAVVYILRSVAVAWYVRRHYPNISFREQPKTAAFSQRWSALIHQIVTMIVNNTDIVLLTLLLSQNALVEVSVYSVYNLVAYSISALLNSISSGIRSSFGQVLANDEKAVLYTSFGNYEYLFFLMVFFCYACMAVLLYPFVQLYCADFADAAVYPRWILVALFSAIGLIQSLRLPACTVVVAAGHYKQTQIRAILEAAINLVVSLLLIRPLGIVGVLIGTLASYLYRTVDMIVYVQKYFLPGTLGRTVSRLLRNGVVSAGVVVAGLLLIPSTMSGWITWFGWAIAVAAATGLLLLAVNWIFERKELIACIDRLKGLLAGRRRQERAEV